MNTRRIAVIVGILFLTSTATFVAGSGLITSYFSDDRGTSALLAGVLLESYTGVAVAAIGALMLGILSRYNVRLAQTYLVLRILECLTIFGIGTYFLSTKHDLADYDLIIYIFTGSGGVVFAYLLHASRLIPQWLSRLGLVGYPMLLAGVLAGLVTSTDLSAGWGVIFLVPGGLFELLLPLVLFINGFTEETHLRSREPHR